MTTILATIFVLGVLIFFHELGHFLMAKWAGIRVERFSLGFPPTLVSKKWGETVYAIGVIPLGGYVKMSGDNPHEETAGKPWEFMSKPVWKRFLVVFAGPFMNFVLAVAVLAGLYTIRGIEAESVYVGNVLAESSAAKAGLMTGDNIVSIDGLEVRSYYHMLEMLRDKIGMPVEIKSYRGTSERCDTLVAERDYVINIEGDSIEVGTIGVGNLVVVGEVTPGRPAEEAGIQPGDIIISVDGTPVKSFNHMAGIIYKKPEQPVEVAWRRGDQIFSKTLMTYRDNMVYSSGDTVEIGLIGVGSQPVYERINVFSAVTAGFDRSFLYVRLVSEFVWKLIIREAKPSEIGGPIFIGKWAGSTAQAGIDVLLEFLALLSVNLAVLNVLPIPILDGGHIVFLVAEKIKGSPPSIKARVIAQQIGIAFMIILVIFVTFNDIMRLI